MDILHSTVFQGKGLGIQVNVQIQIIILQKGIYILLKNILKNLFLGVATYCKNSYSPFQAEEGLAGTFNVHDDKIDFYDNVHSSFTDEGLRALDAEGRCVMTLHKFKVRNLFSFFYT